MEIPPLLLKVSSKTKHAGVSCGALSLWTFFSGQWWFPNMILLKSKSEISNSLYHDILSPFLLGSRCRSDTVAPDRHSDIMQDFTDLSVANTSKSQRGLWIMSHCFFTHAWWANRVSIQFLYLHARLFTRRWSRSDLKDQYSCGGYILKRWAIYASPCCLSLDLFTQNAYEVLLQCP